MQHPEKLIRSVYLHLIALAGLLIFSFGLWKGVDLVLSKVVFAPGVDTSYCEAQAKDHIRYETAHYDQPDGKKKFDADLAESSELQTRVAVLQKECEEKNRANHLKYRKNSMITVGSAALAWLFVGGILFVSARFWLRLRRD